MAPCIEVAVVVLRRDGRVLLRRRLRGEHLEGLWEFPGGKLAPGEQPRSAAVREAREEMSVEACDLEPRETIEHDYGDRRVRLHVFEGTCAGEPSTPDGAEWRWIAPRELPFLPMPEANRTIASRLAADANGTTEGMRAEDDPAISTRARDSDSDPRSGDRSESLKDLRAPEPAPFATVDEIESAWRALAAAPTDRGLVGWIVARRTEEERLTPRCVRLTRTEGVPGDRWRLAHDRERQMQVTIMQIDVAKLIAAGRPLSRFGDNFFLDLDLSSTNLPAGSRLRAGAAVLEITSKPHTGCAKFRGRFGDAALRFTAKPELRGRNLRGVHARVIEDGEVAIGDQVEVIARALAGE